MTANTVPSHWDARWRDLGVLQCRPVPVTDDDILFDSDLSYFRALLADLWEQAYRGGAVSPFPQELSDELFWLRENLKMVTA